jgi:general secretion pathway protein G
MVQLRPISKQMSARRQAFTLIEILIVVVILGILAAIVIPQFTNASLTARENTMKDELRYLRSQITVYKAQHNDRMPGPDEAGFIDQLTKYSDIQGNTSDTNDSTYKFGPYLSKMPSNPLSGKTDIKFAASTSDMTPDDTTGWIYLPGDPFQIIANTSASDANGTPYASY